MERDEGVAEIAQHFGGEMQSRRRRSHGARGFGENGLVAFDILLVALPAQVRRQRNHSAFPRIQSRLSSDTIRSPSGQISSTRTAMPSIVACAPRRILRPGRTRHFQRVGPAAPENRNSILPSSENRRALTTRVLFRTSRSPLCKIPWQLGELPMLDSLLAPMQAPSFANPGGSAAAGWRSVPPAVGNRNRKAQGSWVMERRRFASPASPFGLRYGSP